MNITTQANDPRIPPGAKFTFKLTRDELIDALVYDTCTNYGAQLGRKCSSTLEPNLIYTVALIPLFDGDYDQGGAYWGVGQNLYGIVAIVDGDEFIEYRRGDSFNDIQAYLVEHWESTAINADAIPALTVREVTTHYNLPCFNMHVECNWCGNSWDARHWQTEPHENDSKCGECGADGVDAIAVTLYD